MNHKAIIAKVDRIVPIPGADRIQVAYVLGESVVVSKDVDVGFLGVFFPVDLQLSEDYCRNNNLFRDSEKNLDTSKKGFFENSRRVRCQPFLKVKSQGYFADLSTLDYLYNGIPGTTSMSLKLGDQLDEIDGVRFCEKYVSEKAKRKGSNSVKQSKANAYPLFDKHVDSAQFKHVAGTIEAGSLIYFHNKRHGTSFRVGKLKRKVDLPKWKTFVNNFVQLFPTETDYQMVVGSRNVVIECQEKEGWHGKESFRFDVAKEIYPFLEDGMIVYGEIVGFVNGSPIMPNGDIKSLKDKQFTEKYGSTNVFHYGCKEHEYKFHIYRITRQTINGLNIDMSQKELEEWCKSHGLEATFEVHPPIFYDGDEDSLRELVDRLTERPEHLSEDWQFKGMIGEGVILRVESGGYTPKFYKSKSYAFRVLEGILESDDMESMS